MLKFMSRELNCSKINSKHSEIIYNVQFNGDFRQPIKYEHSSIGTDNTHQSDLFVYCIIGIFEKKIYSQTNKEHLSDPQFYYPI